MDKSNYSLLNFVALAGHNALQFCPTMASRGEIVKKVVQESGLSISRLAQKINISRAQLYLDFANPDMSFDRILAIGKVLKHDFSQEFKDLTSDLVNRVNEEPAPYVRELQECRGRLVSVQEQLIEAMRTVARYREKYGPEPV
jgi:transcriptional regulator with XRE-family HTH domain